MKIYKSQNIIEQRIDNEMLIYVTVNDSIVNLDVMGTKLWDLIYDGIEFDDLVNQFFNCFEEKPSYKVFYDEIDDVLSSYMRAGLLQNTESK